MNVGGSHVPELLKRPLLGLREIRRARKPRTNPVKQSAGIFHDVRVVEALVADTRNRFEIESLGSSLHRSRREGSLGFFRSEGSE